MTLQKSEVFHVRHILLRVMHSFINVHVDTMKVTNEGVAGTEITEYLKDR